MDVSEIVITKTANPKPIPEKITSFGQIFSDHIFVMDWSTEDGWHSPRITAGQSIEFSPAAVCFHYGQGIFEGLKAYRDEHDDIRLFRARKNFERLNRSAKRICMPEVDIDFVLMALKELVLLEKDWIPTEPNTSLYIRPFMIGTESTLGVHAAKNYQFIILLSPSGPYYKDGLKPIDILVEKEYVRAVRGGLGEAKTMANYAASLLAGMEAEQKGYQQVLWLDGVERKFIEEVGSMNIMFKINGTVVTPALNGSILPGITRDSILQVLRSWGVTVEERQMSLQEVIDAGQNGTLEEIFGTGTAAVISPVKNLHYDGLNITATSDYPEDSLSYRLYNALTAIQYGKAEDNHDWISKLT